MSTEPTEPLFYFRAATPDGGTFAGSIRAASLENASQRLADKGFQPLRLAGRPIRTSWLQREIGFAPSRRLTLADSELVCRELALLLGASIPIADALSIATTSMPRTSRASRFLVLTRNGMRLGQSLSVAMENTGYRLPANLSAVVRSGETTGALATSLLRLSESFRESLRFSRAVSSALAYPMLLVIVSLMVFGLLAFFVAPSLAALFVSMGRPVPPPIAILTGLASFGSTQAIPIGIGLAIIALVLASGAARAIGKAASHIMIRLPVIGDAMRWSGTRRFAATLHLYMTSGLTIADALPNALSAAGFPAGPERLRAACDKVRAGAPLARALHDLKLFPSKFIHMMEVGESSGRIVQVLASAIDEAQAKVEQRFALVTSLLAPALILVIGGLIGAVIFSVFSSLLQINELVA